MYRVILLKTVLSFFFIVDAKRTKNSPEQDTTEPSKQATNETALRRLIPVRGRSKKKEDHLIFGITRSR